MQNSKLDRDLPLIEQQWDYFGSLVRQELTELSSEQEKLESKIKNLKGLVKIIEFSKNDINFLLVNKEIFLELAPDLNTNFSVLEAFKKRNNLDNDVAIMAYNAIQKNDKVVNVFSDLERANLEIDKLKKKIDSLKKLINEVNFSPEDDYLPIDLINELCEKYNINEKVRKMLFIYPIIKAVKKPIAQKEKPINQPTKVPKENKVSTSTLLADKIILDDTKSTDESAPEMLEEKEQDQGTSNYQDYYNQQKNRYEKLKENAKDLLNKYYAILAEMKKYEIEFYKAFCNYTEDEFGKIDKTQFGSGCDEAYAKILAIGLFDAKTEIEKILISIPNSNYTDKESIEYLEVYISEFQSFIDRLKAVDKILVDKGNQIVSLDQQKVFFLTDGIKGSFIPETVIKGGYETSLRNIMEKAQGGLVSNKKGCNIMPLTIHDDKIKKQLGRTVFAIRNSKIIISYIKLNSNSEVSNDGGIIILTAVPLTGGIDAIQAETDKIIKDNIEKLMNQISLIEAQDPQQLSLQNAIRDEIDKTLEKVK